MLDEECKRMINLLDAAEDMVLSLIAAERLENSVSSDFIEIEKLL